MEATYNALAQRATMLLKQNPNYRVLILVAGAPGSGKSTIAERVADILNEEYAKHAVPSEQDNASLDAYTSDINSYITNKVVNNITAAGPADLIDDLMVFEAENDDFKPKKIVSDSSTEIIITGRSVDNSIKLTVPKADSVAEFAQVIPMDGFHLPRSTLAQFNDSDTAFARRGAAFTFDSMMVVKLVELLKSTCDVIITNKYQEPIFTNGGHDTANPQSNVSGSAATTDAASSFSWSEASKTNSRRSSISQIDDNDFIKSFEIENLSYTDYLRYPTPASSLSPEEDSIWKVINGKYTLIPDIHIPNFNHALKDPTPSGVTIKSTTRVIIMEGLYLLLNDGNWANIRKALVDDLPSSDSLITTSNALPEASIATPYMKINSKKAPQNFETWKIQVDENVARDRVSKRHLNAGIVTSLEDGAKRYDMNDCVNGRFIDANSFEPDITVFSVNE